MGPMSSNNFNAECIAQSLSFGERRQLLSLAQESIRYGLQHRDQMPIDVSAFSPVLQALGASFVTLKSSGELRGCIGSILAARPLALDVTANAYAAAFRDPRFLPLALAEFDELTIHLSLLSPLEPLQFTSEEDLLAQLRPGVDGIMIEEDMRRGTFLPTVWESLPDPGDFLRHLKLKAGLSPGYWSLTLKVYRYTIESIG